MKYIVKIVLAGIVCLQFSCKNFLEIDPPKNSLVKETVFQNDGQANSAIAGIYAVMASSGYASGNNLSITCLSGVSSDELTGGYNSTNIPFYENQITPELSAVQSLYSGPYKTIYAANSILEGLAAPSTVTPPVKAQIEGEARFVRAFVYFYLVNLYGEVPLQLSTDYRITQTASRVPVEQIYKQIISDLRIAEGLLTDTYVTAGRVRPNKSAAQALLARIYLYQKDYENAEKYATGVIAKTAYKLVSLDAVFLSNSQEAIWQLMPTSNSNTQDGNLFILTATPLYVSLSSSFVLRAFEGNDNRQAIWIRSFTNSTGTYYYPFKYKVKSSTTVTEYSMVLRLAEQYLIRAEARINQTGKIESGISDLNLLRDRARPLPSTTTPNPLPPLALTLSKSDALLAVERERRVELFAEWGHRWLDLKRTSRANSVLQPIKSKWQPTDVLYPIPLDETSRNQSITQNDGY